MAYDTNPVDINRATEGLSLPPDLADEIFTAAVEESAIMRLSRNIDLPGRGLAIPVIVGDPVAEFVAETAEKPVSNTTFDTRVMQPYKVAVIETFSNEFRRDLPRLYDELVRRLPYALGRKVDQTVFFGPAPGTGFDTLASVDTVDIETKPFDGFIGAMGYIARYGGDMNGIVLSPAGVALAMGATDNTGRPLFTSAVDGGLPAILGAPVVRSISAGNKTIANPPVYGFAGDWSKAIFGRSGEIEVAFSDQATLNDGVNLINLWQRNMFAVRAEFEVGFVIGADDTPFVKLVGAAA